MKYFSRLNVYKNSTGSNMYDPTKQEAFSYRHWRYLQVIEGQLVFNDYSYSNSTSKHQSDLRSLLGYPSDMIYIYTYEGLHGIDSIKLEIERLEKRCEELKTTILTKGTRRKTNLDERLVSINSCIEMMEFLVDTFNLKGYTDNITNAKRCFNESIAKYGGRVIVAARGFDLEEAS